MTSIIALGAVDVEPTGDILKCRVQPIFFPNAGEAIPQPPPVFEGAGKIVASEYSFADHKWHVRVIVQLDSAPQEVISWSLLSCN